MPKKYNKEEILKKFKKIHNEKYDYILWNESYKNSNQKIPILCKKCNKIFYQRIKVHYDGHNCPYGCYGNSRRQKLTFKEFIKQLIDKKLNKYFYFLFDEIWWNKNYQGKSKTKFPVKCKLCGNIYYKTGTSLYNKERCFNCFGKKKINKEKFLKLSKKVHTKYIYDIDNIFKNYQGIYEKIPIICPKHGIFYQTIANHIFLEQGCPKCNESKGERKIRQYLEENNIDYKYQYPIKIEGRKKPLYFDFYIPEKNLAIEFDGIFHYKDHPKQSLEIQKERDELKNQYCKENIINLLRIPYWEYKNIKEILKDFTK